MSLFSISLVTYMIMQEARETAPFATFILHSSARKILVISNQKKNLWQSYSALPYPHIAPWAAILSYDGIVPLERKESLFSLVASLWP